MSVIFDNLQDESVTEFLRENKIGVIPTDTIYGIVASALSPRVVEDIYTIKERDRDKPLIVLVSSNEQMQKYFEVSCPDKVARLWPAKLSVILPVDKFPHLHRGGETIAFRIPARKDLRELIKSCGPIVAPSANKQGDKPAKTIEKARNYFEEEVDFYVNDGELKSKPSTLVSVEKKITVLREGAVNLEEFQ